jgi:pimeloyl-ACP methyl ester carboxylesterase
VVRGSLIEFSKEGFKNWVQDFNIFNLQPWIYTDTVKKAYVANGAYNGYQNMVLLKDITTQKTLEQFIESLPKNASIVLSGHSLGGNLAQVYASYLWNKLNKNQRHRITIISFGATVVGNTFFAQDLEEKFPNAERYEIDKDIAPKFPSIEKLSSISSILGADSLLGLTGLAGEKEVISKGINILNTIAKEFNVIPKENNYTQSVKHLKLIQTSETDFATLHNEAILGVLEKVYYYHRIDQYAKHFNVPSLDGVLKK